MPENSSCPYSAREKKTPPESSPSSELTAAIGVELPAPSSLLLAIPKMLLHVIASRGNIAEAFSRSFSELGVQSRLFRVAGFEVLITINPALAKRILIDQVAHFPKTDWERRVLQPVMNGGLIILQGKEWERDHKVLAGCFGSSFISELPRLVYECADARMSQWNGKIALGHELRSIVNEVMRRYFLNCDLGQSPDPVPDLDELSRVYAELESLLEKRVFDPFSIRQRLHRRFAKRSFDSSVGKITDAISQGIAQNDARYSLNRTPLSHLLAGLDSTQKALEEIRTLTAAGLTTGHLLTWIFQLVATHPQTQRKLFLEILETLQGRASARDLSLSELESMPLLNAVVQEGLRLYPPAPFLIRSLPGSRDRKLAFIPIWAMHRHPSFWDRADEFVPERWDGVPTPEAFIPFGAGPRVCIGRRFSLIEARMILFEAIRRFELLAETPKRPRPVMDILTRPHRDPKLLVLPRS